MFGHGHDEVTSVRGATGQAYLREPNVRGAIHFVFAAVNWSLFIQHSHSGRHRILRRIRRTFLPVVLRNRGYCPTCAEKSIFESYNSWLRDHYVCRRCGSIPRERALMVCIERFFPSWREAVVHESSPGKRGASVRLAREVRQYIPSQFFPQQPGGSIVNGVRCENLERLSFEDESIDLHVTQDVFEHIFDPVAAFREIARTLRPGGMHVFTTPITENERPSQCCARLVDGRVQHLKPAEYHGNPLSKDGSLVTYRWGYDICELIFRATGLYTHVVHIDSLEHGVRAELNEVLVTRKPAASSAAAGVM